MRTTSRGLVVVAAATALALGACSSPTSSTARSRPPRWLNHLEAASEDVIDQIPRARWARVDAAVRSMQRSWRRYHREAVAADARQAAHIDRALRGLARSSERRDGLGTEQAANDVSAPVVELLARYSSRLPVQIGRLDVIGRQIVVDVGGSDVDRARVDVGSARREWSEVRRSVLDHHGTRVAARTERVMAQLLAAASVGDPRALERRSTELLELVDGMERLYRHSSRAP